MQSTRIVQGTHAALMLAVCVGLVSPALTWADNPTDRQHASGSVPVNRNSVADASGDRPLPKADPVEELSRAQIEETVDLALTGIGAAVHGLVFAMINWDLPTTPVPTSTPTTPTVTSVPVPDTFVPPIVPPPPALTDDPGNGTPPPPPPPPTTQSPEPGTLIAGLAGAGAIFYRIRRRRTKERRRSESEVGYELAM